MKTLAQGLAALPDVRVLGRLPNNVVRVHTDTRSLQPGDCFVALRGERFDAHDFLPQAAACGAVAVLAERGVATCGLPGVQVPDAQAALVQWATAWRAQFNLPVIAVAGSNGKTTVTQMVASILRAAAGAGAHATAGNFNNHIGVPLTLLRLNSAHRLSVVELGMNHPGEIALLAAMVQPTVALVNNAQREHQEFMDSVAAVAQENGQVIAALGNAGAAVFPSDDAHTPLWRELAGARRVVTFSDIDSTADVHTVHADWRDNAWSLRFQTPQGAAACSLRIAGRHNLRNALAASACALAAGVALAAVVQGLNAFEAVGGRSRALALRLHGQAITVVDDTYNANPDSVLAAIDVLAELPGPRMAVLGDMGEVGNQGLAFHLEVLRHALAQDTVVVHCVGDWMAQACAVLQAEGSPTPVWWADVPSLTAHLQALWAPAAAAPRSPGVRSLLVKGSRFIAMERVVQGLQAVADTPETVEGAPRVA